MQQSVSRTVANAPRPGISASAVPSIFAPSAKDLRKPDEEDVDDGSEIVQEVAPIPLPSAGTASDPNAPLLDAMKRTRDDPKRFEEYVKSRPNAPDPNDETFDKTPVEAFGLAMLKGMGFKGEDDVIPPYLLDGRPNLLGLGAKPKLPDGPGQGLKHKRQQQFIVIGSVGQIEGTHRFAVVIQTDGVPGLDMIRVVTPGSSSLGQDENKLVEIDLPRKRFLLISNATSLAESHPARRVIEMNEIRMKEEARKAEEAHTKRQKMEQAESGDDDRTWLRTGLHVLIVDEKDRDNYKKKGVIIAVDHADARCDVRLDKEPAVILKRLKEKYLQTVVSDNNTGNSIVVVAGKKRRGSIGRLVERDKRKELAWLRFPDGNEESFDLDDVCELIRQ